MGLLYWRDASLYSLELEGCISVFIIAGGMHLSIYKTIVWEGCIFQYIRELCLRDAALKQFTCLLACLLVEEQRTLRLLPRVDHWEDVVLADGSDQDLKACMLHQ